MLFLGRDVEQWLPPSQVSDKNHKAFLHEAPYLQDIGAFLSLRAQLGEQEQLRRLVFVIVLVVLIGAALWALQNFTNDVDGADLDVGNTASPDRTNTLGSRRSVSISVAQKAAVDKFAAEKHERDEEIVRETTLGRGPPTSKYLAAVAKLAAEDRKTVAFLKKGAEEKVALEKKAGERTIAADMGVADKKAAEQINADKTATGEAATRMADPNMATGSLRDSALGASSASSYLAALAKRTADKAPAD